MARFCCSVGALPASVRHELLTLHGQGVSLRALVEVAAQRGHAITKDPLRLHLALHVPTGEDQRERDEMWANVSMIMEVGAFTAAMRAVLPQHPEVVRSLAAECEQRGAREMAETLIWLITEYPQTARQAEAEERTSRLPGATTTNPEASQ